LKNCLYDAS
jgi:hypothetical protein